MQWSEIEPVLRATYALIDENGTTSGEAVCRALAVAEDDEQTDRAIRQLTDIGYIKAQFVASGAAAFIDPSEKGLVYCSGWPSPGSEATFIAAFLGAVDDRAADDATPEPERSRLKQLGGAAAEVGKDVLTEIAAKVLTP